MTQARRARIMSQLQDARGGGMRGGEASPHPSAPARGGRAVGVAPGRLAAAGGQQPVGGESAALHSSPSEGDRVTPVSYR